MRKDIYVAQLPDDIQNQIRVALTDYMLNEYTDINVIELAGLAQNGMDGRLCDLDDVIDVDRYVKMIREDDGQ